MLRLARYFLFFSPLLCLTAPLSCHKTSGPLELHAGMHITQSVTIKQDTFVLNPQGPDSTVITISGDHLTIDFNGAVLKSAAPPQQADQFWGTGIRILGGKNIQLKNVIVQGFKIGLLAINCDSLQILDSDFSYNYRQQLKNTKQQENSEDRMVLQENEQDEWLQYGAAVYLKNCQQAVVKNIQVTGGQNGLLLAHCQQGLFYNNTIQYNSGIGIGLYQSSHNWILHNRLDWNSSGDQNAASIFVYAPSDENVIAYNSATHSGRGIIFQATPTTHVIKACKNNLLFGNDCSHCSSSGIALHAGSNNIIHNHLEDNDYGIQAKQSHHSQFLGNTFRQNNHALSIQQGQSNVIRDNIFDQNKIGIHLYPADASVSSSTPEDHRTSEDYEIHYNFFTDTLPLQIVASREIKISANRFKDFQTLLDVGASSSEIVFTGNRIWAGGELKDISRRALGQQLVDKGNFVLPELGALVAEYAPRVLADGQEAFLPEGGLRGRQYILMTEWGPYDFRYPSIWLRSVKGSTYTFVILGPQGNWQLVGGTGIENISRKRGAVPATVVVEASEELSLELKFIGEEARTVFGESVKKGKGILFAWE